MDQETALKIISSCLPISATEIADGLPTGKHPEYRYDEALLTDIAEAVSRWRGRQRKISDPYVVWFFNGQTWSVVTEEMRQNDAYREWYRLTNGAKSQNNSKSETYYYLGSADEKLEGRHRLEEAEDDFSISYLLRKSFGD